MSGQGDQHLHDLLHGATDTSFDSGFDGGHVAKSMAMRWTPPPAGWFPRDPSRDL